MRVQVLLDDASLLLQLRNKSSPGDSLLITTAQGLVVDRFQFNFMCILEASEEELATLRDAGYWAAGPPSHKL